MYLAHVSFWILLKCLYVIVFAMNPILLVDLNRDSNDLGRPIIYLDHFRELIIQT